MATISPGADLSLIEWIEREAAKQRAVRTILADQPARHRRLSILRRIPAYSPRTDDMRQMIEDIANARP